MEYYKDNHITIYHQDCRIMAELPDHSVQCVVTSPPYWGLRKYAGEQELVWGDSDCKHEWGEPIPYKGYKPGETNPGKEYYTKDTGNWPTGLGNICSICGAWKGSYGLEPTPEMYIQHTIEILREIRRVLRKDGVVFWNIGDSYAGGGRGPDKKYGNGREWTSQPKSPKLSGFIKPKDLCLIPFRVAIAAQQNWYECLACKEEFHGSQWGLVRDKRNTPHFVCPNCLKIRLVRITTPGWWARSVIIWSKPNPMPESVTDRPTESHEYILMLTKSARYYWDADAVREKYTEPMNRWGGETLKRDTSKTAAYKEMQNIGYSSAFRVGRPMRPDPSGRNIRTVWEFPTQPYPEAHFAVFPEKLPELCIKATTPEVGCCAKCGAPWGRIMEKRKYPPEVFTKARRPDDNLVRSSPMADGKGSGSKMQKWLDENPLKTIGWQPTCKCNADTVPSVVLDPFAGAGTTLWVAKKLGRMGVGYELSEEYCQLALNRNRQQVMI